MLANVWYKERLSALRKESEDVRVISTPSCQLYCPVKGGKLSVARMLQVAIAAAFDVSLLSLTYNMTWPFALSLAGWVT